MPTWRTNLVGEIMSTGHNRPLDNFIYSDFYINYINLLTNDTFIGILKRFDFKAEFVLHSGFSCYENLFSTINSEYVSLCTMDDFSYREAFAKASLLITDFSSIAFDFAYLQKPLIYFQFDENSFFETHYRKSTWSYRENGFGTVVDNTADLIKEIEKTIINNCVMDKDYLDRVKDAFLYNDVNNCKRIMEATKSLFSLENIKMDNSVLAIENEKLKESLENHNKELDEFAQNYNAKRLNYLQYCLDETRNSFSYRLGYSLTAFPRWLRRVVTSKSEG